jgi:hypothetical protein
MAIPELDGLISEGPSEITIVKTESLPEFKPSSCGMAKIKAGKSSKSANQKLEFGQTTRMWGTGDSYVHQQEDHAEGLLSLILTSDNEKLTWRHFITEWVSN